jgi:Fur family transcriptional regulator, ferric uptake regulator
MRMTDQRRVIARHDFGAGRSRYEPIPGEHHDHLIDLRSGEVIEFRNEEIERLQKAIAERLGFRPVDHRLELYAVALDKSRTTEE